METLNDIVEESAAKFGDKTALMFRPGFRTLVWTFSDLADIVPRVARHFTELGIRPGDRVLTYGVNRPEYGIGMLGIWRAQAVTVPLDMNSTPEFTAKIATHTHAVAALVSSQTRERAEALGLRVIDMETLLAAASGTPPLPKPDTKPDDTAEILFTSGTTGEPKGSLLSHRNLLASAIAITSVFPMGPHQRLISLLPFSHIFEQSPGFLCVLITGASTVYPTSRQLSAVQRTVKERRVTLLLVTPAVARSILIGMERRLERYRMARPFRRLREIARPLPLWTRRLIFAPVLAQFGGGLRWIGCAGAALDPALGQAWRDLGVDLLQGYGMSEAAPGVSFNRPDRNRFGSVGVPLPGVEVKIAADGEVLARGPNIFRGYLDNEAATRAAFDGDWFRTGDLGRFDDDGFLWLHGRKKDMIALPSGLKVYPEDVENVLAEDPRIREIATVQRPEMVTVVGLEPPGEDIHVHAVFLEPKDETVVRDIVRDANTKLSSSQRITKWTIWPDAEFPTTPTQKVKKREVIARLLAMRAGAVPAVASASGRPRDDGSPVARIVARTAKVPLDRVRPDAQLAQDLGLDSLGRVDLLGAIEEELGANVDDAALAPDATIADLERLVAAAHGATREGASYTWPLSPLVRAIGISIQELLVWPLVHVLYDVKTTGSEKLRALKGPVIFTPNHCLRLGDGVLLTAIPLSWRWRLTLAATDELFRIPFVGWAISVIGNAFPLAHEGAVRRSLERLGARLDRRFSVLIYPEGQLTLGGPLQPFKSGTGLIAVEGGTPIVPMKLKIEKPAIVDRFDRVWKRARVDGWRGKVEVVFGDAITFPPGTAPAVATAKLQAAVTAL